MYSGAMLQGSKMELLAAICDYTAWSGNNTTELIFSNTFTVENSTRDWSTNWSEGGQTDYYSEVNINDNYQGSGFSTGALTVGVGKELEVNVDETVLVERTVDNSGIIVLNNGASLMQYTDESNTGNGNYIVKRNSTEMSSEGVYTYWSSPVSSSTLGDVVDAQLYYSFDNTLTEPWVLETAATNMVTGVGYATIGPATGTYPLVHTAIFETANGGSLNNGNITVSLDYSNVGNNYNLLGNPYPSAIDAEVFVRLNNSVLEGTLYFWTHNSVDTGQNTTNDYVFWNLSGGNVGSCGDCVTPDGKIASGQGFFAQAISNGEVKFKNSMRIRASGNNNEFYKAAEGNLSLEKDRIWLNLNTGTDFSQLLIGFFPEATDGIDARYDGVRMTTSGLNFFSPLEDTYLAILGKSPLKQNELIPLGYESSAPSENTISISNIEGQLRNSVIQLHDLSANVIHNLKNGPYVFTSDNSEELNRFQLEIISDIEIYEFEDDEDDVDESDTEGGDELGI